VAFFIFNPSRLKIIYHTINWVSKQEGNEEMGSKKWEIGKVRILGRAFVFKKNKKRGF
jgi:hypothetical protein